MSGTPLKSVSIIVFQLPHLPTHGLINPTVHCSTLADFQVALQTHVSPPPIIVCPSDLCTMLAPLVADIPFSALYLLHVNEKLVWPNDVHAELVTVVESERELMRHLCMKSMLSFFQQAINHQKSGDYGVANMYAIEARRLLQHVAEFE